MATTVVAHRCPAIESSEYLCGRIAKYRIKGTSWCHIHARRVMDSQAEKEVNNAGRAMGNGR